MYYSDITNEELQKFHRKTKLTASYSELNELNSKLFNKDTPNKCFPMFYTDKITGNDNVTILEDLVILYLQSEDLTSLYFQSNEENRIFHVAYKVVELNSKYFLQLHFFDRDSLMNLSNYSFKITQSDEGITGNYETNEYGNIVIELLTSTGTFTITSNTTNQVFEFEISGE